MPPAPHETPCEWDYDCEVCCRPMIIVFTEDEVYVVLRGRAEFLAGENRQTVSQGTVIFVEAGREHRFVDQAAATRPGVRRLSV